MRWIDKENERRGVVELERRVEVKVEEAFEGIRVYLHEDVFWNSEMALVEFERCVGVCIR